MNILSWIILGLLAGLIAKAVVPGQQEGGWIVTILLGITGAFLGGALHSILQTGTLQLASPSLSIPGVFIAVLGAILVIYLYNLLTRRSI